MRLLALSKQSKMGMVMGYALSEGTVLERVGDEAVLVSAKGDTAILNETANFLISQLLSGSSLETAAFSICKEYQVPEDIAATDMKGLVDQLGEKGFLCFTE
jgi:hypothetical protein